MTSRCSLFRRGSNWNILNLLYSPIFLGLIVGILIRAYNQPNNQKEELKTSSIEVREDVSASDEEINKPIKEIIVQNKGDEKTFNRPKFIKDELNIRKLLLLVVVEDYNNSHRISLSDNLIYKENIYNWTLDKFVSDTIFFGNFTVTESNRIKLTGNNVLEVIKEIINSYMDHYSLFYLIPSTAFINGQNLKKYYNSINIFGQVYAGLATGSGSCDLHAGVLLSRNVLIELTNNLDWCFRNSHSYDQSQSLQMCINYSAKAKCQDESKSFPYHAQQVGSTSLVTPEVYDKTILYYGINNRMTGQILVRDMTKFYQSIHEKKAAIFEDQITNIYNSSRSGVMSLSWPIGSQPRFQSRDRHDKDQFVHFNLTHQTNQNQYDIFSSLDEHEQSEVKRLMSLCSGQDHHNLESELVMGWRKFDATRGTDYILETQYVRGSDRSSNFICKAARELALPQIIPMPFVTENVKISLIIPVLEKDSQSAMSLIKSFAKNSIEKGERIFIMLVFLYTTERPDKNNDKDFFKDVKQLALQISKKYRKGKTTSKGNYLLWYSLQTKAGHSNPSNMEILDLVTAKLDNSTIILFGSPNMEIRVDYFNRVRMNTVKDKQVFCPAPFVEYHPVIVYGKKRPPLSLSFAPTNGHFDSLIQSHIGFYKSDYIKARQKISLHLLHADKDLLDSIFLLPDNSNHICDMMKESKELSVLRAPEPSLRLRYQEIVCDPGLKNDYEICLKRRTRSFGRKPQLANQILDKNV